MRKNYMTRSADLQIWSSCTADSNDGNEIEVILITEKSYTKALTITVFSG